MSCAERDRQVRAAYVSCAERDRQVRAEYVSWAERDKLGGKLFARDNTIRELENENILLKERIDDLAAYQSGETTP